VADPLAPAPAITPPTANIVWRFIDGRAGHDNQTRGLISALDRITLIQSHDISVPGRFDRAVDWCRGQSSLTHQLPAPDLIVGAGHDTHLPMLTARRQRGGRIVVLMRPTLPARWFDLCIVPEHDGIGVSKRVLVTRGVLNAVQPQAIPDAQVGLILLGGPSAHFHWNEAQLLGQLRKLVDSRKNHRWTIATSRRTPESTCRKLNDVVGPDVTAVRYQSVDANWLPSQLATAGEIWVTEDSVSMIYEALTAGGATGIIDLEPCRHGRLQRGLEKLVAASMVMRFTDWQKTSRPLRPAPPLREADRCAAWIKDHWLSAA